MTAPTSFDPAQVEALFTTTKSVSRRLDLTRPVRPGVVAGTRRERVLDSGDSFRTAPLLPVEQVTCVNHWGSAPDLTRS
jgi:hypothetical protein